MPNHKILSILLCCFLSLPLFARIDVVRINNATDIEECDGSVEMIITGNTPPYEILIVETGTLLTGIDGPAVLDNLCAGQYTLEINAENSLACASTRIVEISFAEQGNDAPPSSIGTPIEPTDVSLAKEVEGISAEQSLVAAIPEAPTDNDTTIDFTIYPNPATDVVMIEHSLEPNIPLLLVMTNTFGQVVYQQALPEEQSQTRINVGKFSAGLYYVSLRQNGVLKEGMVRPLLVH